MLDLIAAAKAAAAPAARPRRTKKGEIGRKDGAADEEASGDGSGEAEDGEDEEQHSEDEQDEVEPDVTGSGAEAAAASAAGGSLQTFVFSATLTLPQALRRRLQKRALTTSVFAT